MINSNSETILSIRCTVYNHEPYLRQCLDGFIMQKTNFTFEAIVHDDCSTDKSIAIIKEYAEKYPHIIKPIYEKENQYSKHDGSLTHIMNNAISPSAKYIALCEGDDYWTDPYKLQKQVDFMEAHPEYSMCFHNAIEHYESTDINDKPFSLIKDKDYTGKEIYSKWIIPTASVLLRKEIFFCPLYQYAKKNKHFIYGDIVLFLSCAHEGKIRGMSDCMSVYRRHSGGVTFQCNTAEALYKRINHHKNIYKTFGKKYKRYADMKTSFDYFSLMKLFFHKQSYRDSIYYLIKSIYYSPSTFINRSCKYITKRNYT